MAVFGKRVLFSLHNFVQSWPEHGFDQEVGVFFGPKIRFCYRTTAIANGPFVALGKTVDFAPSDLICQKIVLSRYQNSTLDHVGIYKKMWVYACYISIKRESEKDFFIR